jgi:hypothetical protein
VQFAVAMTTLMQVEPEFNQNPYSVMSAHAVGYKSVPMNSNLIRFSLSSSCWAAFEDTTISDAHPSYVAEIEWTNNP